MLKIKFKILGKFNWIFLYCVHFSCEFEMRTKKKKKKKTTNEKKNNGGHFWVVLVFKLPLPNGNCCCNHFDWIIGFNKLVRFNCIFLKGIQKKRTMKQKKTRMRPLVFVIENRDESNFKAMNSKDCCKKKN